jgi:hypothetical protein
LRGAPDCRESCCSQKQTTVVEREAGRIGASLAGKTMKNNMSCDTGKEVWSLKKFEDGKGQKQSIIAE